MILTILEKHFFVRTILFHEFDPISKVEYRAADIMGRKPNVLMAEYVYLFLEKTVYALWEKFQNEGRSRSNAPYVSLRSEKRHFIIGVLDGFSEKLDETNCYQNLGHLDTESKALIKVADKELDDYCRRKYPRVSTTGSGSFNPDLEPYKVGVNEGKKIRIHKPVVGHDGYRGNLLTR